MIVCKIFQKMNNQYNPLDYIGPKTPGSLSNDELQEFYLTGSFSKNTTMTEVLKKLTDLSYNIVGEAIIQNQWYFNPNVEKSTTAVTTALLQEPANWLLNRRAVWNFKPTWPFYNQIALLVEPNVKKVKIYLDKKDDTLRGMVRLTTTITDKNGTITNHSQQKLYDDSTDNKSYYFETDQLTPVGSYTDDNITVDSFTYETLTLNKIVGRICFKINFSIEMNCISSTGKPAVGRFESSFEFSCVWYGNTANTGYVRCWNVSADKGILNWKPNDGVYTKIIVPVMS